MVVIFLSLFLAIGTSSIIKIFETLVQDLF